MLRIIRIVVSPQGEWQRIAAEGWHAALLYAFALAPSFASFVMTPCSLKYLASALGVQQLLGVPDEDAAQFVAIALVLAIVASTLAGGAVGALGLL